MNAGQSSRTPSRRQPRGELGRDQRLGVGLEGPADRVLAVLCGVRLGEALREEELDEVVVVLEPVVAVPLPPPDVVLATLVEVLDGRQARSSRRQRQSRRDEDQLVDSLRVARGNVQRPLRAPRQRHQHGALRGGRIHHCQRVGRELLLAVGVGLGRAVRAPVAPPIERQHTAVAGEVRDLHLPVPRVDDRPRRHEEHRGLARAVDLVVEVHAVAFDVTRRVRIPRTRLLGRRGFELDRHVRSSSQASIHSSSSRWPVSIPESRSSMIPSLNVITSETSASSGISIP